MPRLRFTRDERGYEHTFLVHTTGRRGKERSRILYWFRSPPAVRVGRPALDPDAFRAIEEANPGIVFDWPSILDARPAEPEPAEGWRARRGRQARDRDTRESPARENAALPIPVAPDRASPVSMEGDVPATHPAVTPAADGAPEGGSPDQDAESTPIERSAVQRALGSEGLVRVRARYAEVLARISSQVADAAVGDELRVLAERLNPDAWVTDAEVLAGLESFERVLETVRQRLGRPRRRGAEPQPGGTDAPAGRAPEDRTTPAPDAASPQRSPD